MTEMDAERFLREAEDCLRQAQKASSRLDAELWLRRAKEWTRLAKEVEQRA